MSKRIGVSALPEIDIETADLIETFEHYIGKYGSSKIVEAFNDEILDLHNPWLSDFVISLISYNRKLKEKHYQIIQKYGNLDWHLVYADYFISRIVNLHYSNVSEPFYKSIYQSDQDEYLVYLIKRIVSVLMVDVGRVLYYSIVDRDSDSIEYCEYTLNEAIEIYDKSPVISDMVEGFNKVLYRNPDKGLEMVEFFQDYIDEYQREEYQIAGHTIKRSKKEIGLVRIIFYDFLKYDEATNYLYEYYQKRNDEEKLSRIKNPIYVEKQERRLIEEKIKKLSMQKK